MEIKDKIVGGYLLGSDGFIEKIKKTFLKRTENEIPMIQKIQRYKALDGVIEILCKELKMDFEEMERSEGGGETDCDGGIEQVQRIERKGDRSTLRIGL